MSWTTRQYRMLGTSDGAAATTAIATVQRKVWTQQPQVPVGIDWSNPITQGLCFAFEPAHGQRNAVFGEKGESLLSGVTPATGRYGKQLNFSGSQANRSCSFGNLPEWSGAAQASWDILVYFSAANSSSHFFGQWEGTNSRWLLQGNGAGGLVWVAANDISVSKRRRWDINSGVFTTAGWYRIIASWKGSTSAAIIINGIDRSASLSVVNNDVTNMGVGGVPDYVQLGIVNGGTALNGSVAFARGWTRGLSLSEMRVLHNNPWQIFTLQSTKIWVPA